MVFCILNWHFLFDDLSVVLDEKGYPLLFETRKEAREYAEENLNFEWKVVELE